jgi:hypothetical protein
MSEDIDWVEIEATQLTIPAFTFFCDCWMQEQEDDEEDTIWF